VTSSTAIFAASDIEATIAYYKNILGFESSWTWGEPPTFGSTSCGGVSIMFSVNPDLAAKVRGHTHWIKVDDADALYRRHLAAGAKIVQEIENKPWGFREYVVEDLNGYHLRIAGPPSSEVAASQPFPDGVTLERQIPTPEEYERVTNAAFGNKGVGFGETASSVLERTWNTVVARSPSGEAIGVLRIMHDAPGWFSIWDVAVDPSWQAKRIGSKMMEEAVDLIREACPGAIVFLFTFKHGFYERLGFKLEGASMRWL
jgi:ribosomal protein S18 acetylase RimI-like enzyme